MLRYTTVDGGKFSPQNYQERLLRDINLSSPTSKAETPAKMAFKKRGKRSHGRAPPDQSLLPPIQSGSPLGMPIQPLSHNLIKERRGSTNHHHQINRKEIRTPYVSHMGINRVMDVATPYVMHRQVTKLERGSPALVRDHSKISENVVEFKHDKVNLNPESTFTNIQKFPANASPILDKRPRGRYGRGKGHLYEDSENENSDRNDNKIDAPRLHIQSSQAGLYQRAKLEKSKSRTGDESFSIRRKIEQFRRWHEEQYTDKLKKLKQEVDQQFILEQNRVNQQKVGNRGTPSTPQNNNTDNRDNQNIDAAGKIDRAVSERSQEKMDEEKECTVQEISNNTETLVRSDSFRTWHTWRDVNESYAYDDVKKYIKDNELMDSEREVWIKNWIIEVNKATREGRLFDTSI